MGLLTLVLVPVLVVRLLLGDAASVARPLTPGAGDDGRAMTVPAMDDASAVAPDELAEAPRPLAPEPPPEADEPPAGIDLDAPPTGALVVRVRWHDGGPAAGVGVGMMTWGPGRSVDFARLEAHTDERGEARWDDVRAGTVTVYADRGGSVSGAVLAGEESLLELMLPEGLLLRGVVLDHEDLPAVGAEVWLSAFGNTHEGRVVARTDGAGRFAIEQVSPARSVGARRPPAMPSTLAKLYKPADFDEPVTLRLGPPGATLTGRVVDADGAPLAGARLRLGGEYGWPARVVSSTQDGRAGPPPLPGMTDTSGRFHFEGVPVGPSTLLARATGCAPLARTLRLEAGENPFVELVLPPGCRVRGTLRDDAGAPLPSATVVFGEWGEFTGRHATTDAAGRYLLDGMPAGLAGLTAAHEECLSITGSATLIPEQEATWDAVLVRAAAIRGRVLHARDDSPVAEWLVSVHDAAEPDGSPWAGSALTKPDGSFALTGLPSRPHHVLVRDARDGAFQPRLAVRDVLPGAPPLTLRVDTDVIADATLAGCVRTASGEVPERVTVHVERTDGPAWSTDVVADDASCFAVSSLLPGRYELEARAPGATRVRVGPVELPAGGTVDVGLVVLGEGASLVARLSPADEALLGLVRLTVRDADGFTTGLSRDGATARAGPLAAGPALLLIAGNGVARDRLEPVLAPGGQTWVDVSLQAGVEQVVVLAWSDGGRPRRDVGWSLETLDGRLVHHMLPTYSKLEQLVFRVYLAPGAYRLLATAHGAPERSVRFEVGAVPGQPLEVAMD